IIPSLPDGRYPFIDERLEAPPQLEVLFKGAAAKNGVEIIRDEPAELRCKDDAVEERNSRKSRPSSVD
ncbi:MAG: hypothetical protein WBQ45_12665, partial [Roseiarcus sp.]